MKNSTFHIALTRSLPPSPDISRPAFSRTHSLLGPYLQAVVESAKLSGSPLSPGTMKKKGLCSLFAAQRQLQHILLKSPRRPGAKPDVTPAPSDNPQQSTNHSVYLLGRCQNLPFPPSWSQRKTPRCYRLLRSRDLFILYTSHFLAHSWTHVSSSENTG